MPDKRSVALFRLAGYCAYASGVLAAFGIVFLVLLYVGFFIEGDSLFGFGLLNDIAVMVQVLLTLPVALALHRLLGGQRPQFSRVATVIGIAAMLTAATLQWLLISGAMPFQEQVGYVSAAMLVYGGWIVAMSYLGRASGQLPISRRLSIAALFYIGFPVWAFRVGARLREDGR